MSFVINGYLKRNVPGWKRDYLKVYIGGEWKWRPAYRWNGANWKYVDTLGEIVLADAVGAFVVAGTYTLDDYAVETSGSFEIAGTYTLDDYAVETSGSFEIAGTYTVA